MHTMTTAFVLALLLPGTVAVMCYQCTYYKVGSGTDAIDEGNKDCADNPTNVPTIDCPHAHCLKGVSTGNVNGVRVYAVERTCDKEDVCMDGIEAKVQHPDVPSLQIHAACSEGDLSNSGVIPCAPRTLLTALILLTTLTARIL